MKRLFFLPAFLATLIVAACEYPADIRSPISDPGEVPYDEHLIGTWYSVGEEKGEVAAGAGLLTITPGEDGFLNAALALMEVKAGTEGGAKFLWFNRSAYASVIDGVTYYNTRSLDAGYVSREKPGRPLEPFKGAWFVHHPERGFWIIRPEINDEGLLTLHVLDNTTEGGGAYYFRHLAAREVDCGEDCSIRVFDLSSEELIALIRSTDPELLFSKDIGPFARIEGVYPPEFLD